MKFAAVALAALTVLRLAVAAATPLSPDETYYWVFSRALAAGYYDHPPMVALWVSAGWYVAGDTALGVRLLAPFSAALGTILLARVGTDFSGNRRVGLWAALLLNATLGFGLGAVSMTPDTPLLLFWILSLAALGRLLVTGNGAWFLAVGIAVGLAMVSKFSALFLALGIAPWLLWVPSLRIWLRTVWPWLGGALALAILAPVLAWNAGHDWAGLQRQGGRVAGFKPENAPGYLLELLGGQIGLLTPIIFLLACAGLATVTRAAWRDRAPVPSLLALLCLPALLLFVQHTFTDRVQGNWPAILYPAALLAAAMLTTPIWMRLRAPAVALGFGLTALVYVQAALPVLPIPPRLDPSMKRLAGWAELAGAVDAARRAQGAAFITADDYAVAARLAFELPGVTILVTDRRWLYVDLPRETPGASGILVRSARLSERADTGQWREQTAIGTAARTRAGVTAEAYRLYRVTPQDNAGPFPRLPTDPPGWSPR